MHMYGCKDSDMKYLPYFSGLQRSDIRFSIVLGVLVVRYIMLPQVGLLVVRAAIKVGLLPIDPLYHFVLLIQYALPPAMNIGVIQ